MLMAYQDTILGYNSWASIKEVLKLPGTLCFHTEQLFNVSLILAMYVFLLYNTVSHFPLVNDHHMCECGSGKTMQKKRVRLETSAVEQQPVQSIHTACPRAFASGTTTFAPEIALECNLESLQTFRC